MPPGRQAPLWIGVDCGASGVRVHEVAWEPDGAGGARPRLGPREHAEPWPESASFHPLPLEAQRASPGPTAQEQAQGERWLETLARSIGAVAHPSGPRPVCLAIAAPGLKTADGRGIALALHAPRIPRLLELLERRLALGGIALERPIGRLLDDGLACAWAERRAAAGAFLGVREAYWLGGGSGLAEALVVAGTPAALETRLPRAWQLTAPGGDTYDELLSARGLNRRFALRRGTNAAGDAPFPEERATFDAEAAAVLAETGEHLARFLLRRLRSLREQSPPLEPERVVLGARLGALFVDPRAEPLRQAAFAGLTAAELPFARSPEAWLVASRLRAAAALGAAAAARAAAEHAHA